jgi:hypothetical protein
VHSSKIITMSEFSTVWMRIEIFRRQKELVAIDRRGELHAFLGDLAQRPRLKTWKPPESVRIGLSQPMNWCRPPTVSITSSPGAATGGKCCPDRSARRCRSSCGRHGLDRAISADRHENRGFDDAVFQRQRAATRSAAGGFKFKIHVISSAYRKHSPARLAP